ncbi:Acyl-CoA N-acyltransferase [Hirsutella rhossiliensis]|uniref:Acyl-CoA N-acyltransferase n=1 Tax=Hirsutella rhossiliensis TaxID=111463 RepID=A0A9P8N491_9HYPO|nr:Acyl-CoA N-acyltransferase [Hirsutella rhossiliensis]KAH0966565.1 Acyl-CoA N-acyltransferase [Hirsutella rhossiliensis]
MHPLPSASSPTLVLAQPSEAEQVRTWTQTRPWWGASYTPEAYVARERLLLGVPLARDGGMTPWILTDGSVIPDDEGQESRRPVLASCETLRKRALVRDAADGVVRDVWAHGVASVFTYPEFRRRGYANRMMTLLGEHFAAQEAARPGDAAFSVLFSDIGTRFYAELGWTPYESTHLSFPVKPASPGSSPAAATPILDADLPAMAELDERIIRDQISRPPSDPAKTRVAILPNLDTLRWHFAREAFMSNHLFAASPTVHGAMYTPPGAPNSRVWGLWSRNQTGGKEHVEKNTLDFLRFVVEDEALSDEELSKAIRAIVGHAQVEAQKWLCASMNLWNPHERVKRLVAAMADLKARYVVRDNDSITSLRWLGPSPVAGVDWVANEKFEWC